jgi:large subunit ribosomal protein L6
MELKILQEEITIPEGISVVIEENKIKMKKDSDELIRKLDVRIDVKVEGNKILLKSDKTTKNNKKIFGTIKAHIKNMIKGLTEKFKYKLQVANVHFPMNVSHDKENNSIIIKNFLGERKDRKIKLIKGVDIKIDKDIIELESIDIEKAGQCAANIEKGAKVRNKDRRIFQDGIFITEKPGRIF